MRSATLKKIGILLLLGFLVPPLHAQVSYDTVTATVTDPNSNPLANAAYSITLVNAVGNPVSSAVTPNGQIFNAQPVRGNLNASGALSVGLVPNTILTKPAGTQWKIVIGPPQDSAILVYQPSWSITYTVSITAPVDLSSQLSALSQPISFVNLRTNQSTIQGSGGSGVTNQTLTFLPLPGSATTLNAPSHVFDTGALSGSTLPFQSPGAIDTTNGAPVFPRLLLASGIGGATDVCALFAKQSQLDNAAGYIGRLYHDNLPSGSATQTCSLNTLWDPNLNVGSPIQTSARYTMLSGGTYKFPGLNIPAVTTLEGQQLWGSTAGTGTIIQPLLTGNTGSNATWMGAYSLRNMTPLVNLGPSQGTSGVAFSIESYLRNLTLDCQVTPNMVAALNSYTQQGGGGDHLSIKGCSLGVMTDGKGPSGGSQNRAPWRDMIIAMPNTPTSPVCSQVLVVNGGSGYTHASVSFSGATTTPVYDATIVGGIITAWTPDSNSSNPFGQCPNGTTVTATVTGDGTGATADVVVEMLLPSEGMYFATTAGGGSTEQVSITGSGSELPPNDAVDSEAPGQIFTGLYGESVKHVLRINETSTAGVFGDFAYGITGSSANNWIDSLFENGGAGPAGFTLIGMLGSTSYVVADKGLGGNMVPSMEAGGSIGGNGGSAQLYSRDASGQVISNLLGVANTVPIGMMAFNATSSPPQFFMPVKNSAGYAQSMSAADPSPCWGIMTGGSEAASHTSISDIVTNGPAPVYFDNTAVPGDYWGISPSSGFAHDLAATPSSPPASGWGCGIVMQDGLAGSTTALATPVVSGVTSSVTIPSSTDVQYKLVARTMTDQTTSAASAAIDVTNGPQGIGGSSSVTLSSLPVLSTFQDAMYRTVLGRSAEPSVTAVCNTTLGTYTRIIITGTMTGIWFPPTVAFSAGVGTNPAVTLYTSGGQVLGGTFTNYGSGCTGNVSGTVTASTCEVGFLKFVNGSTSFKDNGICARPDQSGSTTPPASALIGPRVTVNPQPFYGPSAGSSGVANLVPDTGFKQGNGGYWNLPAGVAIVANGDTNPNSAANAIVYTGTGSPSGIIFASAGPVNLVSGQQYSFSSWVDTTNITAGSVLIRLCNTPTCGSIQYAALGPITGATALTQRALFTASATVSAFYVAEFNLTATNATPISIAEPQVARATNLLTYVTNDGPGQGDPASGIKSAIAPQFSALAAGTGHVCIHADTAGNLSPTTGSDCGSGGGSGQAGQFTSVTFSGTPTFTASSNTVNAWSITLTGNVTSSTLASAAAGQYLTFNLCQDATGSRTFAWPTGFSAATAIFPTASTCTQQTFSWNGSTATPLGPANVTGSGLSALWYGPTGTAPGTPPSGFLATWFDSTDNALKTKNSSGTVASAIVPGSCTSQVLTAISDNAAATCTTLTLASAYFANQGTTTTVLHGNAAGNLSFGSVALAADVSGLLPHANIAATAVTPGSYTSANITVAADGSVTAASNGSGGGGSSTTLVSLTSTTAAANSTTAQQLQEVAVTAGFFNTANGTFGLDTAGYFTTPTGQTPTVTITHKLCTVSGCGSGTAITLDTYTSGAASVSSTDAPWRSTTTLGTSIAGTSGQLEVHGNLSIGLGTTAAVAASTYGDGNTALASAINLSGALFLDTFVTFSTNGATSNTAVQKTTRLTAGTPPASISATVSPSTASVNTLATQAFTATMSNDFSGQGVTWALSGAGCSGATCGTLSSVTTTSVTYTGPSSVPSPATVTLTATSIADTTKTSTATITVTSSGGSGATIVQPTSGNPLLPGCANNSTTNTCALPLSVTSGNTLFVMIAAGATGTVGVPVKSAGTATIGTCTAVGSGSTAGGEQQWYTCAITGSGSLTISETFSTSTNVGVFPFEVNNSAGADTVTCTVGAGSGGACYHSSNPFSTAYVTTALTPTTAGDLILLARMGGTSQTFSALTPYTLSGQGPGTTGNNTSWFTGNFTNSGTSNVAGAYTTTPGSDTEQDGGLAVK